MQAVSTWSLGARRRAVTGTLVVVAGVGLAWGAAFGAGVLYGRTVASTSPAPAATTDTRTAPIGVGAPVNGGRGAPVGGGDGGGGGGH